LPGGSKTCFYQFFVGCKTMAMNFTVTVCTQVDHIRGDVGSALCSGQDVVFVEFGSHAATGRTRNRTFELDQAIPLRNFLFSWCKDEICHAYILQDAHRRLPIKPSALRALAQDSGVLVLPTTFSPKIQCSHL
jgi:hypothetical protein